MARTIEVPNDRDTVKMTDAKLIYQCTACGHEWTVYLSKVTAMSNVCIFCLAERFKKVEAANGRTDGAD